MKVPKILVTGATGKSGYVAIETLVKQGISVRGLAHREGPKVDSLRALGVEVVIGDFFNLDEMVRALDGIEKHLFLLPRRPAAHRRDRILCGCGERAWSQVHP